MARLFTAKTGEHELTWGLYDRFLHWLVYGLNDYMERRAERHWEKLDPGEPTGAVNSGNGS